MLIQLAAKAAQGPDFWAIAQAVASFAITFLSIPALAAAVTGFVNLVSPARRRRVRLSRDLAILKEMPVDLAGRAEFKAIVERALAGLIEREAPVSEPAPNPAPQPVPPGAPRRRFALTSRRVTVAVVATAAAGVGTAAAGLLLFLVPGFAPHLTTDVTASLAGILSAASGALIGLVGLVRSYLARRRAEAEEQALAEVISRFGEDLDEQS